MERRRRSVALLAVAAVLAAGCGGALAETETDSTTLEIGHRVAGGRVAGASSEEVAVSIRMRADLEVFEPAALEGGGATRRADQIARATIRGVTSSDEATVRIVSFEGSACTIEGLAPGTAEVRFETDRGPRTFLAHVAEPASVAVRHFLWQRLPEGTRVAFARGGVGRFEMTRRDRAGRVLGGYGAALPVHVDPPRAARLSVRDGDLELVDVHFEQAADEAALRPLGGAPLSFAIVDPAGDETLDLVQVGAEGEGAETDLSSVPVGRTVLVAIRARRADGTRLFGLIDRATLSSEAPEVCTVTSVEAFYADGVYELRGETAGGCALAIQAGERTIRVATSITGDP